MAPSENKGIFVKTIELLGSIILIMIFVTVLYGIFTNSFEAMLWTLFDWIIEILKPIISILALFIAVFRGLPLVVSFLESILEDVRSEREYKEVWERLELSSPTPHPVSTQKTPLATKEEVKTPIPTESRGDVIVIVPSENGGQFLHVTEGSREHTEALARKASAEKELRDKLNEAANEKLKELKPIFIKGCKVD